MTTQTEASAPVAEPTPKPAGAQPGTRLTLKVDEIIDRWYGLSVRVNAALREPVAGQVQAQIGQADADMLALLDAAPDASLLLLIHGAGSQADRYSVMHALLVGAVCDIAVRGHADWDDDKRSSLRRAALTMNIAMTRL